MKLYALQHRITENWLAADTKHNSYRGRVWTEDLNRRRLFRRISDYKQCKHYSADIIVHEMVVVYPRDVTPIEYAVTVGGWESVNMPDGFPRAVFIRMRNDKETVVEYIHNSRVARK